MEAETGKPCAALDGVVALDLAGGRVSVCVEGVLDVEHFEVEVVLGLFVEFLVAAATFDPLGVPGEFEEVVYYFGEGVAEYAGDFQEGEKTGCAEGDVVVGWEEREAWGTCAADEGEDGFGERHAGDSDVRPGGRLARQPICLGGHA